MTRDRYFITYEEDGKQDVARIKAWGMSEALQEFEGLHPNAKVLEVNNPD